MQKSTTATLEKAVKNARRDPSVGKAWQMLVFGDDRSYAGNEGYSDVTEAFYAFDSTVPNHGGVEIGDLAVLRGKDYLLGIGRIYAIDQREGVKYRNRCPECQRTTLKERRTKTPRYRCHSCHSEFQDPVIERMTVIDYRAHFASSWCPLKGKLSRSELDSLTLYETGSSHAIQPLNRQQLIASLESEGIEIPVEW